MLEKEKERLLVERNKLSIKLDVINNRLEEIEIETKRLVEMEGLDLEFLSAELKKARDENREWKSVSINY
jgi:predicted nuclease with TOPRIM domain